MAQALRLSPTLPTLLSERSSGPSIDGGGGLPGVDTLLDPDRDGHGADASALAAEVGDDPAVLTHLELGYVQGCEFPSPQRAADQQGEMA